MSSVWTTLAPALAAGGFAIAGLLVGARSERRKWVRQARMTAYLEYAAAIRALIPLASRNPPPTEQEIRDSAEAQRLTPAFTAISLLGPRGVDLATEQISKVLRARPFDLTKLESALDDFAGRGAIAVGGTNGYSWVLRIRRLLGKPLIPS